MASSCKRVSAAVVGSVVIKHMGSDPSSSRLNCVTLGTFPSISKPHFCQLENKDDQSTYHKGLPGGIWMGSYRD